MSCYLCFCEGHSANDDDDEVFISMEESRFSSPNDRQTKTLSALKENRINTNKVGLLQWWINNLKF